MIFRGASQAGTFCSSIGLWFSNCGDRLNALIQRRKNRLSKTIFEAGPLPAWSQHRGTFVWLRDASDSQDMKEAQKTCLKGGANSNAVRWQTGIVVCLALYCTFCSSHASTWKVYIVLVPLVSFCAIGELVASSNPYHYFPFSDLKPAGWSPAPSFRDSHGYCIQIHLDENRE